MRGVLGDPIRMQNGTLCGVFQVTLLGCRMGPYAGCSR